MKSVSFSSTNPVVSSAISPQPFITRDEISRTWYSVKELQRFKLSVEEETRKMIQGAITTNMKNCEDCTCSGSFRPTRVSMEHSTCCVEDNNQEEEQCYRGLEHRISLDRVKRKLLAVRAVLEVQKRVQSSSITKIRSSIVVSHVSKKFSRVSVEEAQMTGCTDFLEAYKVYSCDSSVMMPLSRKRSLSCAEAQSGFDAPADNEQASLPEQRRVRMRVAAS